MASDLVVQQKQMMDVIEEQATRLADSELVPKRFRGNVNNVAALIQMANRAGMEPISLMQACYEVHGEYALESKAAIAMLQASGLIIGPPRYSIGSASDPKKMHCICTVRDAQLNEDVSLTFWYSTAEKQGWTKNPHWKNDPLTMIRYRSAIQLIRSSYPSVLMGMHTVDEIRDANTVNGTVVRSQSRAAITHNNVDLLPPETESGPPANTPSGNWPDVYKALQDELATASRPVAVKSIEDKFSELASSDEERFEVQSACKSRVDEIAGQEATT